MFSLIVTIISIALVAALAVATIYYGGPAFNQGKAGADAAKVMTQSQQILAASTLFSSDHGRWPLNVEELVATRYLGAAPVAFSAEPSTSQTVLAAGLDLLVPSAYAEDIPSSAGRAGLAWKTVSDNTPQYVLGASVSEAACRKINEKAGNGDGIREAADVEKTVQCFGTAAPYSVLSQVPNKGTTLTTATLQTVAETASGQVLPNGGNWVVQPTAAAPSPVAPTSNSLWPQIMAVRNVALASIASVPNGFINPYYAPAGFTQLPLPDMVGLPGGRTTSWEYLAGATLPAQILTQVVVEGVTAAQCVETAAEGGLPVIHSTSLYAGPGSAACYLNDVYSVGQFDAALKEMFEMQGWVVTTQEDARALEAAGGDTMESQFPLYRTFDGAVYMKRPPSGAASGITVDVEWRPL